MTKVGIEMVGARCTFDDERVRRKRIASCFLESTGFGVCYKHDVMFKKLKGPPTCSSRRAIKFVNMELLEPFGDNWRTSYFLEYIQNYDMDL